MKTLFVISFALGDIATGAGGGATAEDMKGIAGGEDGGS